MLTRQAIRGGFEEYRTDAIVHRTLHFTKNLESRSFQLVPKGRISSKLAREDTSQCWQRSPGGMDFHYNYGCRGPLIKDKVEMLAFDVVQL
jgi:hypothetical protein